MMNNKSEILFFYQAVSLAIENSVVSQQHQ